MFDMNMMMMYDVKLNNLRRFYALALGQNDIEGIHDLRVELKYLKAFFRLTEAINPDFDSRRRFKCFKAIARATCGLRDSQVQMKLAGRMASDTGLDVTGFSLFLKKKEKEFRNRFVEFSLSDPLQKLEKRRMSVRKALKRIEPVRADTRAQGRFFNLKNRLILIHRAKTLRNEILHQVRKQAKETHYTLEIVRACFPVLQDTGDFINRISSVHKLLGKWHDYEVCGRLLDEYRDTNPQDTPEMLSGLAGATADAKKSLRKEFRRAFGEFAKVAEGI